MSLLRVLRCVAACLCAASLPAQDGLAGALRTVDGRTVSGTLVVAADGKATLTNGTGSTTLSVDEFATFEPAGVVAERLEAPHRLWLRSGGELPVVRFSGAPAADGKPARVVVETSSRLRLEFPLATVRALRQGGLERPEPRLFRDDLAKPAANDDLLYVVQGGKQQRSSVTITGVRADGVDFLLRGEAYEFDLKGVAAVVFGANTGLAPDRQGRPRARLELRRGEVFEGRLLGLDATTVRCRLDEGVEVEVPGNQLLRLSVQSDRLAWLGDLPAKVTQTPAFDRSWEPTYDKSLGGPGFRIGGAVFARGIGLVPRTRLEYELGGRFDVFEAVIGIDDRGGPEAHAVFRVLVDGVVVFESAAKTRGLPPEPIRVPLQKAQRFAIEVDFGKNFDLGDHCVFADARVLQQ